MCNSEKQFNDILAQILVRVNKSLRETKNVSPFGMTLSRDDTIEILVVVDVGDSISEHVDFIQDKLKEKVRSSDVIATAVIYVNYNDSTIDVYLENHENYCLKAVLPVRESNNIYSVLPQDISTEDGGVFIFPYIEE